MIRAFAPRDLAQVVSLRGRSFRMSAQGTPERLTTYLRHVFFDSPLRDDEIPSLVAEGADGEIEGFLGVTVQRMWFGRHAIRVAIATQLMARADSRALVGRKLARAYTLGPQDLSMSDSANAAARTLWHSIGGQTAFGYSLQWTRPLRPWSLALASPPAAARGAAWVARPIAAAGDAWLHHRERTRFPSRGTDRVEPFSPADETRLLEALSAQRALRPAYDRDTLAWLLAEAAAKWQEGPLESLLVRESGGRPIGWFTYGRCRGGLAQVVQLGAPRRSYGRVFAQLLHHAYDRGVLALVGRTDPQMIDELAALGCRFDWNGPWTCVHTRRREILTSIERGDAFLSRLEGEWWMRF